MSSKYCITLLALFFLGINHANGKQQNFISIRQVGSRDKPWVELMIVRDSAVDIRYYNRSVTYDLICKRKIVLNEECFKQVQELVAESKPATEPSWDDSGLYNFSVGDKDKRNSYIMGAQDIARLLMRLKEICSTQCLDDATRSQYHKDIDGILRRLPK